MNKVCKTILTAGIFLIFPWIAGAAESTSSEIILPATNIIQKTTPSIFLEASIYEIACTVDDVTGIIGGQEMTMKNSAQGCMIEGDLYFNGHVLNASRDGWLWDGSKDSLQIVKYIGDPRLVMNLGERGSIQIMAKTDFPYFVKGSGDVFRLKTVDKETGVKLEAVVNEIQMQKDSQPYLQYDIQFEYSAVVGRKPIPGVSLDVGEPIFASQKIVTSINQRSEQYFGFWAKASDRSFLLVKVTGKLIK